MKTFAYLISEDNIKTNSQLGENLWSKDILNAIRYTQDIDLVEFIGEKLYDKLMELVDSEEIILPENSYYKDLLDDYVNYFLINQTIVTLIPLVSTKIGNFGAVKSNDEYVNNNTTGEIDLLMTVYGTKAKAYARKMQKYIIANIEHFPEFECGHLRDSFDSNIWLGGERGRLKL